MLPADAFVDEQLRMNDCYYDNKDWRVCKKEVSRSCNPNGPTFGGLGPSLIHCYCRWKPFENAGKDKETIRGPQARTLKDCQPNVRLACVPLAIA